MSIHYYEQHANNFALATINTDMTPIYAEFLPLLPANSAILDAGCGSGRDVRYFKQQGFQVTAFDGCRALTQIAQQHTQLDVQHCTFLEFQTEQRFAGIWACASLLHSPAAEQPQTLAHLAQFLIPNGVFYLSYKYAKQDYQQQQRYFTCATPNRLQHWLANSSLSLVKTWISYDQRTDRANQQWLNALLRKHHA